MSDLSPKTPSPVSLRALLVGSLLVGAISLISPWAILMVKGSQLTSNAIPIVAVLFLFLLTAVIVPCLKVLGRHLSFSRNELIAIYVMMLTGSVVVTTGFTGSFLSVITGGPVVGTPDLPTKYFLSNSIPAVPGQITEITGVDEVRGWDGIVDVMLFRTVGDSVAPTVNSTDVVGYVLAVTYSREASEDLINQSLEAISVTVK